MRHVFPSRAEPPARGPGWGRAAVQGRKNCAPWSAACLVLRSGPRLFASLISGDARPLHTVGVPVTVRTRGISTATAFAVLFSSVVLVGGTASPAAADSSASLPIKSSGDIVVDGVHKRVFISDPRSGKVVATDYNGKVVRQIGSRRPLSSWARSASHRS